MNQRIRNGKSNNERRKIGIGQQSIANIESGTNALTERNFDAICRVWNVNPGRLCSGTGEVFIEQKESGLQEIVRLRGGSRLQTGYGSVVNMGRHRRKPYAARVTTGWTDDGEQIKKYLGFFATRVEALNALTNYNQNPFDMDLRKLTFAEVYERWCKQKFRGVPVKAVYVAAYKNLAPLHKMRFAEIRKRHIQAVMDDCPPGAQAKGHMKSVCTQMYKFAIDLEIVSTNSR